MLGFAAQPLQLPFFIKIFKELLRSSMFHFIKTRYPIGSIFLLVTFLVFISGCTTGSIVSNSRVNQNISTKVTTVLLINITNFPEKGAKVDATASLMMEQFGISLNLGKKLSDAGIKGSSLNIKKMELDPATILAQAISSKNPSHLLQVTVPNGTFRNNSPMAEKFTVQVELSDAKTKTVIWKYMADVNTGREARHEQIVESIITSMRKDGLF